MSTQGAILNRVKNRGIFKPIAEKQISFQVNWVNTQAFLINFDGYWTFQLGITYFNTQGIFSNWVFPQNKFW